MIVPRPEKGGRFGCAYFAFHVEHRAVGLVVRIRRERGQAVASDRQIDADDCERSMKEHPPEATLHRSNKSPPLKYRIVY